ncbi:hypothetical protein KL86CLO1_12330 [uncultured Eubacteriales bacterium]|uniref:Uncharacterized protein n=1 Tax=uncultured Eubacteriales bacterium TaxID=172733 RepID=A0A212K7N0_9FIRM|nr:hypothetical protein KL86CLO1_12330 [uncultured Eubacteriales bacterium]
MSGGVGRFFADINYFVVSYDSPFTFQNYILPATISFMREPQSELSFFNSHFFIKCTVQAKRILDNRSISNYNGYKRWRLCILRNYRSASIF